MHVVPKYKSNFNEIWCRAFVDPFQLSSNFYNKLVKKVKISSPLQIWSGPEGSRNLRFPDFMTTAQDGGKVVSFTHRLSLTPGNTPVRVWVDLMIIVRPERLCHWKIPMTPSGIETATCRFVAWCLNHYATARPHNKLVVYINLKSNLYEILCCGSSEKYFMTINKFMLNYLKY
jgi:hypothetical protein